MNRLTKRIKKNKEVFKALQGGRILGGKVARGNRERQAGIG